VLSRGPLRFKLADLRRVFRAVKEEELCARVTVDPKSGSITVIPCPPSEETTEDAELDREMDAFKEAHPE
jgi:hypothetical protein